jgi:hypothetical protein
LKIRVRTEAFPIATALSELPKRARRGTKLDVNAELLRLGSEEKATFAYEIKIPGTRSMNTRGKSGRALNVANALRSIFRRSALNLSMKKPP